MKYIVNRMAEYHDGVVLYDSWYLGKDIWGGRLVSEEAYYKGDIPSYLGIAYRHWAMRTFVMYPRPLHLIARLARGSYWGFLDVCYWIGVIDTEYAVEFRWSDFWRVSPRE